MRQTGRAAMKSRPIEVRIERSLVELTGQALIEYGNAIVRKLLEAGIPIATQDLPNGEVQFCGVVDGTLYCRNEGGQPYPERVFTWYGSDWTAIEIEAHRRGLVDSTLH